MIASTEELSQVAQYIAASETEAADINALRLADWQRRYPHDLVDVPAAVNPPEWPAKRVSIDPPSKVTRLPVRQRG